MNNAQKYLINNKLNDRHLNDDASVYTSDAMMDFSDSEIREKIIKAKIEVIEKVESFSNGVSMLNFKEILKGYSGEIRDLDT